MFKVWKLYMMPRLYKGRNERNGRYATGLLPVPSCDRLVTFFTLFSILILYIPKLYRNFGIVKNIHIYFGITVYKFTITFCNPKKSIVFCSIPKYKITNTFLGLYWDYR